MTSFSTNQKSFYGKSPGHAHSHNHKDDSCSHECVCKRKFSVKIIHTDSLSYDIEEFSVEIFYSTCILYKVHVFLFHETFLFLFLPSFVLTINGKLRRWWDVKRRRWCHSNYLFPCFKQTSLMFDCCNISHEIICISHWQ